MSESSSLTNPGYLGIVFNWWIGQIADDSTWRDNIIPGKFDDKDSVPGWGYRYKVRIIGVHDQGEQSILSENLPWAQAMYPVTAGGGQLSAKQTPNLRQGMMVFGFFLDGKDQQIPIIMGILGNNAQTILATTIGDDRVTNEKPGSLATSGYATGKNPPTGTAKPQVPDNRLTTQKPKTEEQSKLCAPAPPGVQLNQYGLRPDISLTSEQLQIAKKARTDAKNKGLTGQAVEDAAMKAVSDSIKNNCKSASSPSASSQPGAAQEGVNAEHLLSTADVKRNEQYNKKHVLPNPYDQVGTALKGIQVELENLAKEIDKILQSVRSYIDAASAIITQIQKVISDAACEIARYMKVVFDQIFQYVLDEINKALAPTVDLMFPNERYKFIDIKETITDILTCLYNKISEGLCGLIQSALDSILDTTNPSQDPALDSGDNAPYVEMCSVEQLVADVVASTVPDMQSGADDILDSVNEFLDDILSGLSDVEGLLDAIGGFTNMSGLIGTINGSISSALNFEAFSFTVLGCDLMPKMAISDYFTIQSGGGASPEAQLPNSSAIADKVQKSTATITPTETPPFATPPSSQADVNIGPRRPGVAGGSNI